MGKLVARLVAWAESCAMNPECRLLVTRWTAAAMMKLLQWLQRLEKPKS